MDTPCTPVRLELTVIDNVHFGTVQDTNQSFHALTLAVPELPEEIPPTWKHWRAGQFVMLRPVNWRNENLWARPFSIARVTPRGLVLFFQGVGEGTRQLAQLKAGDKAIVWGPLGTSFVIEETTPTLILAGGIGLVPFCGYMDQHPKRANLHMMFGHTHSVENYPIDTIAQHIEVETYYTKKTENLQNFLANIRITMQSYAEQKGLILACGPAPFIKYIWELSKEFNVRTQLSLENKMACGVGACLGCVTKTSSHWADKEKAGLPVQTCTSGPVFWANEIEL